MEQEDAVNKILASIQSSIPLDYGQRLHVRIHLRYMYVVGFEAGAKTNRFTEKPVAQKLNGEITNIFPSAVKASRAMGVTRTGIKNAIAKGYQCKGFYWEWADEGR